MSETTTITDLPLSKLKPAKDNPRRDLGDVDELAASIEAQGLLQPLVVSGNGAGPWVIVAGHRRHAAAKKAGLKTVPCVVRELSDAQRREVMLVENLQRRDLTVVEEARGYQQLLEDHRYTQRQLAEQVGVTQGQISKRLKLLSLPAKVLAKVDDGGITVADALELAKLVDKGGPGAIDKALAAANQYRPLGSVIRDQLDEWNLKRRVAKRQADLQAKGHAVVEKQPGWYRTGEKDPGPSRLGDVSAHRDVGEDHTLADCHAVWVDPHAVRHDYGDPVVPVCTTPANHPPRDPDKDAEAIARREQQEAQASTLADRAEVRTQLVEQLADLTTNGMHPGDVLGHVFDQVIPSLCGYQETPRARKLLGLPEPDKSDLTGSSDDLLAYAAQGPFEQLRTVWALTLAAGEYTDTFHLAGYGSRPRRTHLRFLQTHGYEPSTYELEAAGELDGAAGG